MNQRLEVNDNVITAAKLRRWLTELHMLLEEDHFKSVSCELVEAILEQTGILLEDFVHILTVENTWAVRWTLLSDFLESTTGKSPSDLDVFQSDEAKEAYDSGDEDWDRLDIFDLAHVSPEREWFQGTFKSALDWFSDAYDNKHTSIEDISANLTGIALDADHPFSENILEFLQFLVDGLREDALRAQQETLH